MAAWQHLINKKPVDIDFVLSLQEVKRVHFPSILTHIEFEDRSTFRAQIVYILEGLTLHAENAISDCEFTGIFSCSVGSIDFQTRH
jgi:hypothetical protein